MKNFFKALVIFTALFFSLTQNISAENDEIQFEKIVVTPSRIAEDSNGIARNVDVITSGDIEQTQANDVAQVLGDVTSVNISNYGGVGAAKTMRMRGSTASQVLVLVDGRPINSPRDGEADLSMLPIDNIDKIEVLHGPGSNVYGSGAMGGTVNILTKNPPREKQETEITSSFGTFRTYTERLSHGGRTGKFGYLVTGEYQSSQGFRENSDFNNRSINTKLEYEPNDNNLISFNNGFYKSNLGAPGTTTDFDRDDRQSILRRFFDLNWRLDIDETLEIDTKVYQNYDRLGFDENMADSLGNATGRKDTHTTTSNGTNIQACKRFSENYTLISGFNYTGNYNNSTASAKHKYSVFAGYFENKIELFEKLKIGLDERIDDYSNFGTQFTPAGSILYTVDSSLKIRGMVGRSFRAPTFNDLYWPDDGWSKGNPNLLPEKGLTKEIGLEKNLNKYLTTNLTYYRTNYTNLIVWAPDSSSVWQPTNINSAVIDGIELKNNITFSDTLGLDLGYTFLSARDKDTHKYLIYQPKNKTDFSFHYKDKNGLMCALKGQFTGSRFHNTDNTTEVKDFFVLGIDISKQFKSGVTYFIGFNNLLNKRYQVVRDYPMPPFSVTSGVKVKF